MHEIEEDRRVFNVMAIFSPFFLIAFFKVVEKIENNFGESFALDVHFVVFLLIFTFLSFIMLELYLMDAKEYSCWDWLDDEYDECDF